MTGVTFCHSRRLSLRFEQLGLLDLTLAVKTKTLQCGTDLPLDSLGVQAKFVIDHLYFQLDSSFSGIEWPAIENINVGLSSGA